MESSTNSSQPQSKPHVNVLIATPGHSVMAEYVKSLLPTLFALSAKGLSFAWLNSYSSLVADARETTLSGTRQNELDQQNVLQGEVTYDKIIWIDSDIAWTPEQFIKLYEAEEDIVTGAYLFPSGDVAAFKNALGDAYKKDEVNKLKEKTEIASCGFGFIAMKPGVFESVPRPWFSSSNITVHYEDGREPVTFPIMGEDVSFCRKAVGNGYKIYLDPTIKVLHHKMVQLGWE
jgi:hypothetical protein